MFVDPAEVDKKHHELNQRCIRSIKKARAEGTIANRRTHSNVYMRFCDIYYLNPYPASDWQFVQFAQYLFDQEKKPDTVQNYISLIRILHRLAGIQCRSSDQIHFKMLMDSFK